MTNKRPKDSDSDVDPEATMGNYKGIYFGEQQEKYQDPITGCHFRYLDLCQRMLRLKNQRKIIDKRLGLLTSSMVRSPETSQPTKISTKHYTGTAD